VTTVVGKLHFAQDSLVLVPVKIAVAVGLAALSWRLLETYEHEQSSHAVVYVTRRSGFPRRHI
jgi:hypothetical protein